MKDPEIDRILSAQFSARDEILPSSGFTASVMDAVRREASAPPPIPFPWKRALPGIVVATFVLVLVIVVGIATLVQAARGKLALGRFHILAGRCLSPPGRGRLIPSLDGPLWLWSWHSSQ